MKLIEITVDRDGHVTVQTKGFEGSDCRQASKFVEEALGVSLSDRPTTEAFQTHSETSKIDQRS
jgi:hypothetical protein